MNIYIIKYNLPLLLLILKPKIINNQLYENTNTIILRYPLCKNIKENKIEVTLELKHLSQKNYNVIKPFTSIITISKSSLNVDIEPIQITLTSFLFKDLFTVYEYNTEIEKQRNLIFFTNLTGEEFRIYLQTKDNKEERYVDLEINSIKKVSKQKY